MGDIEGVGPEGVEAPKPASPVVRVAGERGDCKGCDGTGWQWAHASQEPPTWTEPCESCDGTGFVPVSPLDPEQEMIPKGAGEQDCGVPGCCPPDPPEQEEAMDTPITPNPIPQPPKGMNRKAFEAGYRAYEEAHSLADVWVALDRAVDMADRYSEAILAISQALPNVNRARLVIAGIDVSNAEPPKRGEASQPPPSPPISVQGLEKEQAPLSLERARRQVDVFIEDHKRLIGLLDDAHNESRRLEAEVSSLKEEKAALVSSIEIGNREVGRLRDIIEALEAELSAIRAGW